MALSNYQPSGSHDAGADQDFKTLIGSNFSRAFPLQAEANDNDLKFRLLLDAISRCCSPDH